MLALRPLRVTWSFDALPNENRSGSLCSNGPQETGSCMESRHDNGASAPEPTQWQSQSGQSGAYPMPPGYYAAPGWMLMPPISARRTMLGVWGLACSLGAFLLPVLSFLLIEFGSWRLEPLPQIIMLLSPISAILGVVLSAVGMSKRYTRRGLAIAGLVVGIIAVVLELALGIGLLSSI